MKATFLYSLFLSLLVLINGNSYAGDLDHALNFLPNNIKKFLEYEQHYMSLSVDAARLNMGIGNTQDPFFSPEKGNVFELKSYWINTNDIHVFDSEGLDQQIKQVMFRVKNGQKQVRFFIHPE
jgi:hypothetical protein